MFQPTAKFHFSVAGTVFLFSYSILMLLPGFTLLREEDTFTHIRIGQWILANAKVPVADFYSYTVFGSRWISGQWLAQVLFGAAFNIAQWRGVVILTAVSCSAIIALVSLYLVRNLRFSVAIAWMAITEIALVPNFVARPHIFAYILLVVWLIILLDCHDSEEFRPSLPVLCLLMILWANIHGIFTIGLLFLYVVAGFSFYKNCIKRDYIRCRHLLFVLLAVSVSALLTPYGVYPALLVLQVMNMKFIQAYISEWQSPNFHAFQFYLFYLVALFAAIAGLGLRLQGPRLILFSIMIFFGLSHLRGLVMFFLVAPIILARPLLTRAAWFGGAAHNGQTLKVSASDPVVFYLQKRPLTMPAIFLVLAGVATAYSWHEIGIGPPKSISPSAAIDFVKRKHITGNVFNDFNFGSYLIFSGIPTFIDGRTLPYTDDFVRRYFNATNLIDIDDAFQLLDDYKVSWVLLNPDQRLVKALVRSSLWNVVYSDNYSVVLVRR